MRCLAVVLALLWRSLAAEGASGPPGGGGSALVYAVVVSRHGIRSPVETLDQMAPYAVEAWPKWEVGPGILTPRGRRDMELLGAYYRALFVSEGLLSGNPTEDGGRIFVRSDNDERTIVSGEALGEGLAPGQVEDHHVPLGKIDALFLPDSIRQADPALKRAASWGELGNDPKLLVYEQRLEFDVLERILVGDDGQVPAGTTPILARPDDLRYQMGAMSQGQSLAEAVTLEYADGMPLAQVGFGRFSRSDLLPLTEVVSLGFFPYRTHYFAQVVASNLASHVLASLAQAESGEPVPGALGAPSNRVLVLVGHDTDQAALAALLGIHWRVPGIAADLPVPGGAIVFELRREPAGGYVVRTYYVCQSYRQLREAASLSLRHPPDVAPIFVPGCSRAGPGYDAPLDVFAAHLRAALDARFTWASPDAAVDKADVAR